MYLKKIIIISLYIPNDIKKQDELIPGIIFPKEKSIPPKSILIFILILIRRVDVKKFVNDDNIKEMTNGKYNNLHFFTNVGISLNITPIKI